MPQSSAQGLAWHERGTHGTKDGSMYKVRRVFFWLTAIMVAIAGLGAAEAEPLGVPEGPVLLTVSGVVEATNTGDAAQFDMDMLRQLPVTRIETETIWTEGVQVFEGVELASLLGVVEARGSKLSASAINDYAVEIPVSDAVAGGPIVAYMRNGAPMSVRDKGPLWVIYPYDANPDYRSEVTYARSIWQLDRIEVLP